MNAGRLVAAALVLSGLLAGGGMFYLQVWGYYDRLAPADSLRLVTAEGPVDLPITGFRGIDSDSSPLRARACFTMAAPVPDLPAVPNPTPLNAPFWFDCFDAPAIAADLASGAARGVLVEGNFRFGFDRVLALYPDGRAYLWPQMNACGQAHFDGRPLPAGCPSPQG
jgi:hypothetical protein